MNEFEFRYVIEQLKRQEEETEKLEKKIDNSMVVKLAQTSSSKPSSCHYLTLKKSIIDFYTNLKNQQDKLNKSFDDLKKKRVCGEVLISN